MELLITEECRTFAARASSGGKQNWSQGETTLTSMEVFLKWLARSKQGWFIYSDVKTRDLVVVHTNSVGIDVRRTRLEFEAEEDYNRLNDALRSLLYSRARTR